jgi:hypothetical protein
MTSEQRDLIMAKVKQLSEISGSTTDEILQAMTEKYGEMSTWRKSNADAIAEVIQKSIDNPKKKKNADAKPENTAETVTEEQFDHIQSIHDMIGQILADSPKEDWDELRDVVMKFNMDKLYPAKYRSEIMSMYQAALKEKENSKKK